MWACHVTPVSVLHKIKSVANLTVRIEFTYGSRDQNQLIRTTGSYEFKRLVKTNPILVDTPIDAIFY